MPFANSDTWGGGGLRVYKNAPKSNKQTSGAEWLARTAQHTRTCNPVHGHAAPGFCTGRPHSRHHASNPANLDWSCDFALSPVPGIFFLGPAVHVCACKMKWRNADARGNFDWVFSRSGFRCRAGTASRTCGTKKNPGWPGQLFLAVWFGHGSLWPCGPWLRRAYEMARWSAGL